MKKVQSFNLSEEVIDLLKPVENKSKLVEALLWEHFANEGAKKTIIDAAKMKDHLEDEIEKLERDPAYVKARNELEAVEKPRFVQRILGGGIKPATKSTAHYFVVGGQQLDIEYFDKYVAEKDTNAKVVKGFLERIDKVKAELYRVKSEMKAMIRV